MKINRRKFFQIAGVAGTGVFSGGFGLYNRSWSDNEDLSLCDIKNAVDRSHPQKFNMSGYEAPKLERVRVGIIGLGGRGRSAVERLSNIDGVDINALCDRKPAMVERSQRILEGYGLPKAKDYSGTEDIWQKLCESPDIDLVYIVTPWDLHTPMCVYAMENGKHAAVEVPAALTIKEAWQLVETSEATKKHCMMLENTCYDRFELLTLNMARQGFFGEIVHAEGAYIHSIYSGKIRLRPDFKDNWRLQENHERNGNLYPTHGLGPVAQALNINRGDAMDYLTSMSSNDFQMNKNASLLTAKDADFFERFTAPTYRGNMNTSVIRTQKGKTIMIQHDVTSPNVYSRIHKISGTKGSALKYPLPGKVSTGHEWISDEEMKVIEEKYKPKIVRLVGEMANKSPGSHAGGMDWMMDWRLIDCIRNGLPLDQDVYDAALWSVILPLSEWSVANQSNSIKVPDFTNGSWKDNTPVDIDLSRGGTTRGRANVLKPKDEKN